MMYFLLAETWDKAFHSFIRSFIQPIHGLFYVYISQQRYQSGRAARPNWSSPTLWHDFQGELQEGGGISHSFYLGKGLTVHPFFSFLFCRHTWLAGIISSPIFRHLARVQPCSKFSDRFTEGSAPTYVNDTLTGHHLKQSEFVVNVYSVILEEMRKIFSKQSI